MKYRTAFIATAVFVGLMFVLQSVMFASMQRAIATGWELPQWWRFLFGVAVFWKRFWPNATILILVIMIIIAHRTAEPN
jgi:hypothetical protein